MLPKDDVAVVISGDVADLAVGGRGPSPSVGYFQRSLNHGLNQSRTVLVDRSLGLGILILAQ